MPIFATLDEAVTKAGATEYLLLSKGCGSLLHSWHFFHSDAYPIARGSCCASCIDQQ